MRASNARLSLAALLVSSSSPWPRGPTHQLLGRTWWWTDVHYLLALHRACSERLPSRKLNFTAVYERVWRC